MARNYSKTIAETIQSYMKDKGFDNYIFDKKNGLFQFGNYVGDVISRIEYFVDVKDNGFIVHALLPIRCNSDDINQLCRFICSINTHLGYGDFEINDDYDLTFKYSVPCHGGIVPTFEMIKDSFEVPFDTLVKYMPGVIGVVFYGEDGEKAYIKCAKDHDKHENDPANVTTDAILKMINKSS